MFRQLSSKKSFSVGLISCSLIAIGCAGYLGQMEQIVDPETESVEEIPVAAPEKEDSPPQVSVATPTPTNRPPTMKELLEQRRSRRKPEPPELEEEILELYWECGETLSEED